MKKVQIYCADISCLREDTEYYLSRMAPCYVEKYKSAQMPMDARHELAAGFLLRKHLGIERDEQLDYTVNQKPMLVSGEYFFNLSHSGERVVLAVSDCAVGVDVEQILDFHQAAAGKIFSDRQLTLLSQLEPALKNEWYTRFWTEYEAMLKLKGTGFPDVWIHPGEPADSCLLYTFKHQDYVITCATEEPVTYETKEYKL